jgi:hypothetical protein
VDVVDSGPRLGCTSPHKMIKKDNHSSVSNFENRDRLLSFQWRAEKRPILTLHSTISMGIRLFLACVDNEVRNAYKDNGRWKKEEIMRNTEWKSKVGCLERMVV